VDWQQKAAALNLLSPIEILMRGVNDWYVSQRVEIKEKSILRSVCGNGDTPEKAISDHWDQATKNLGPDEYLVINVGSDNRRAIRWNGFMWADWGPGERE
jgi:hypothetical protein